MKVTLNSEDREVLERVADGLQGLEAAIRELGTGHARRSGEPLGMLREVMAEARRTLRGEELRPLMPLHCAEGNAAPCDGSRQEAARMHTADAALAECPVCRGFFHVGRA